MNDDVNNLFEEMIQRLNAIDTTTNNDNIIKLKQDDYHTTNAHILQYQLIGETLRGLEAGKDRT